MACPRARQGTSTLVLALAATTAWGASEPGPALPIAVVDGHARFRLATPRPGGRVLVVVSALSSAPGPFPVRLNARTVDGAEPPPLADDGPIRAPDLSRPAPGPVPDPPRDWPRIERAFSLLAREGDVASPSNYDVVRARLRLVGRRVQVYVDEADLERVGPETLRDLEATFDDHVFPVAAAELGLARDVDGDGRFTILMTSRLARLGGGRLAVDGFMRAADLDPALPAPFGNRCDLMVLNAGLEAGPHLRTIVAHEYTHAVTASRKAEHGIEEEGWLDEALAHLVEDRHGFSRSNLDYRVSAFLSAPEHYRLVVDDYYASGLFRGHGNRGSTYLFLRRCVDRFGPMLVPALIASPRRGCAALEAATGQSFARLFRDWSSAMARPDAKFGPGPADDWVWAGPRAANMTPGGPPQEWRAAGTSPHYTIVETSPTGFVEIEVAGPDEAALQVTAIPLPDDQPRTELSVRALAGGRETDPRIEAVVRETQGRPVQLLALGWESAGRHHATWKEAAIASAFDTTILPANGRLTSRPLVLPEVRPRDGPFVFKLVGVDQQGRRVVAWADLELLPEIIATDP